MIPHFTGRGVRGSVRAAGALLSRFRNVFKLAGYTTSSRSLLPSKGPSGLELSMSAQHHCIIAYVGEDGRYDVVRDRAMAEATSSGARLILYDADAATRLGEPLPSWWSGEGADELYGNRLGPAELEKAGRASVAREVERGRRLGIDTWAWLPSSHGASDLADYATKQHADLLIVPSDLEHHGLTGWFKGTPSLESVVDAIDAVEDTSLLVVDVPA